MIFVNAGLAQLRIELQAVDEHRGLEQAHVLGAQVAVPVEDALAARALAQQVGTPRRGQVQGQPVDGQRGIGQLELRAQQDRGVIVSGGNVDLARYAELLAGR